MTQTQCFPISRRSENDMRAFLGFVEFIAHNERATRQRTVAFQRIFQVSSQVRFSADEQAGLDGNSGSDTG